MHLQDVPGSVITAGLFFGDYIPLLSKELKALSPDLHIFGFEPSRSFFRAAEATASENNATNARLYNAALGPEVGFMELCTQQLNQELGASSHMVTTEKLDKICNRKENVPWVANKRFEISKFKFKFPRARTYELYRARSRLYKFRRASPSARLW